MQYTLLVQCEVFIEINGLCIFLIFFKIMCFNHYFFIVIFSL